MIHQHDWLGGYRIEETPVKGASDKFLHQPFGLRSVKPLGVLDKRSVVIIDFESFQSVSGFYQLSHSRQLPPLHPVIMPTPEQALGLSNMQLPDEDKASQSIYRTKHSLIDVLKEVWTGLDLPETALTAIRLPGEEGPALPSSFKIGILRQASIGLSALAAAQVHALRNKTPVPTVTVPLEHAVVEYKCERLYTISDELAPLAMGAIGGLHKTSDSYVRIYNRFPNHV